MCVDFLIYKRHCCLIRITLFSIKLLLLWYITSSNINVWEGVKLTFLTMQGPRVKQNQMCPWSSLWHTEKGWDVFKNNGDLVWGRWKRMYNGRFVQIHFIAEDNCLHYTLGNSVPLTVVVLIAWVEKLAIVKGLMRKRICVKQDFKNQNDDLSTENRGRVKLGTAVLLFHDCYKCPCQRYGGYCCGFKPFQRTRHLYYTASHIIPLWKHFTRQLCYSRTLVNHSLLWSWWADCWSWYDIAD